MGTTLVAAVIQDDQVFMANVGDSRAYLIQNGQPAQISRDHSWVNEQVEAGLLTEIEAQTHVYRNIITRSMGSRPYVEVDTFNAVLQVGDAIVLCTDGVSNEVNLVEIGQVVTEARTAGEASAALIELANRRSGGDNLTVIVIKVVAVARPGPLSRGSSPVWGILLFLTVPLVAGLDARFVWTPGFNEAYNIVGAVMLASGLGLGGWAMISNAYFSTAVRIQTDRGHEVCRSGPYRYVRHPGYAGFVLQSLGTPILLGSWWALMPGIAAGVLMVMRASLEDRVLQAELKGYPEFVNKVRYRLVPGLW